MKKVIIFIVVVLIIIGAYYTLKKPANIVPVANTENQTSQTNTGQVATTTSETTQQPTEQVVTYTDSGYSPKTINVKVGTKVTFKNESSRPMWTASGVHPTHTVYSGTSLQQHCPDTANSAFDACKKYNKGESWSFTFDKAGSWNYHNHSYASDYGSVVVGN